VEHRCVEPFFLMLGGRLEHAAAEDVRKQLVARLIESAGRGGEFAGFLTFLRHAGAILSGAGSGGPKSRRNLMNRAQRSKRRAAPEGSVYNASAAMSEETYGPERAERLAALLWELAARSIPLDKEGRLLEPATEMQKLIGTVPRSCSH